MRTDLARRLVMLLGLVGGVVSSIPVRAEIVHQNETITSNTTWTNVDTHVVEGSITVSAESC